MKISELPQEVRELALKYQQNDPNWYHSIKTDNLENAFTWKYTKEGEKFWSEWDEKELPESLIHSFANEIKENYPEKKPMHYDNSKGSLYQFCEQQKLNTYEFDIIKRVMRCRKKGNFIEDLEKTKFLIDLYLTESQK